MKVSISESDIFSKNQIEKVHSFRVCFYALLADGRLLNCGLSHKLNRNFLGMFCSCSFLHKKFINFISRVLNKLLYVLKCLHRFKYSKILTAYSHTND